VSEATASDLMFRPITELAEMVRSGEVSARELVQASLDRIEEVNPELNAFVEVFDEQALAAADSVQAGDERPFAGVPIAIKNNRPIKGGLFTYAAKFMGDHRADYDHNIVRRLKAAGFIPVGTTTIPEWGILPWTNTRRFGPTRNPWDLKRTSGGSSGGSASAVASGMVPIGHANDGGGSTRIPAACCGLVGLKPARNRISQAPDAGDSDLSIDGVLTRTVAETAAVLDILAGYELGDANWAPPPAEPFARMARAEPKALRIGVTLKSPLDEDIDPVAAEATREAGRLLESLGHSVEEVDPPWSTPGLLHQFTAVFGPMVMLQVVHAQMITGREAAEEDLEPLSWALLQLSKNMSAVDGLTAKAMLQIFARSLIEWAEPYDALLTPALAEAPVLLDTVTPETDDPMGLFARSGVFTPFTAGANISGQPAISLPLYQRDDGLPLGVQLIGRPAGEGELLALSAQIEAANPWADRRAPV
jgi:amidase